MSLPIYTSLREVVKAINKGDVHAEARFRDDRIEIYDVEANERIYTCDRESFIVEALEAFNLPQPCASKKEVVDEVCCSFHSCELRHGHEGEHIGIYPGLEISDKITRFFWLSEEGRLRFKRNHALKQSFIVEDDEL